MTFSERQKTFSPKPNGLYRLSDIEKDGYALGELMKDIRLSPILGSLTKCRFPSYLAYLCGYDYLGRAKAVTLETAIKSCFEDSKEVGEINDSLLKQIKNYKGILIFKPFLFKYWGKNDFLVHQLTQGLSFKAGYMFLGLEKSSGLIDQSLNISIPMYVTTERKSKVEKFEIR